MKNQNSAIANPGSDSGSQVGSGQLDTDIAEQPYEQTRPGLTHSGVWLLWKTTLRVTWQKYAGCVFTGRHERKPTGFDDPLCCIQNVISFDPRDWSCDKTDAWLHGIVSGWEDADEVGSRHEWSPKSQTRLRRLNKRYRRLVLLSEVLTAFDFSTGQD